MPSRRMGALFVAPALLLIFMLLVFPSMYGLYYSLFEIQFLQMTGFIGFENYIRLFQEPGLLALIWRTTVYTASSVALTVVVALAVSSWINQLRGVSALVAQLIAITPWVISSVVAALLFRWVFVNQVGLGRYALDLAGIQRFEPLTHSVAAMVLLIIVSAWRTLGYAVVLLLAGMKGVPNEYYEAARVDGATSFQMFRLITLPLLKTPLLITVVVLSLSRLNNVEVPLVVTGGGPAGATNVLPLELYTRAFTEYDFGSAITLAVCAFLANIILVLFYIRLVRWRV